MNNTSLDHCSRCGKPATIQVLAIWPHICNRCRKRNPGLTPTEQVIADRDLRVKEMSKKVRARRVANLEHERS